MTPLRISPVRARASQVNSAIGCESASGAYAGGAQIPLRLSITVAPAAGQKGAQTSHSPRPPVGLRPRSGWALSGSVDPMEATEPVD